MSIVTVTGISASTSHMADLQSQIYLQSRAAKGVIGSLMPWLLDARNLAGAWERVQSADGSVTPGPDGVTCAQLRDRVGPFLTGLADELFHQRYRPTPPRIVQFPKPNKPGKFRTIGILAVRDRIVQAALKQVLEPIVEPKFLAHSFGFRPGRSVPGALDAVLQKLEPRKDADNPFQFGVQLDVADCFDTIDHDILAETLAGHISDPTALKLLRMTIESGGRRHGSWWRRRFGGIVQGGALSPLLCNLYLHTLDQELAELARTSAGAFTAFRYADDLLLLARDKATARRGHRLVKTVLGRLKMRLRSGSRVVPLSDGVEWLGVRIRPRRAYPGRPTRYGYVIPDTKVADMLRRIEEMTTPPSDRISAGAFNPAKRIVSINEQLRDWRQAYLFADNASEVFRELDEHTRDRVGSLLRALTGISFSELNRRHRVKLSRGFWSWEVAGARLSVLSSLAPQAPAHLTNKPAWMRHNPGSGKARPVREEVSEGEILDTPALPEAPEPDAE